MDRATSQNWHSLEHRKGQQTLVERMLARGREMDLDFSPHGIWLGLKYKHHTTGHPQRSNDVHAGVLELRGRPVCA